MSTYSLPNQAPSTMTEYDSGGFDLRVNMGPPIMTSPIMPSTPNLLFDEVQKLNSLMTQGSTVVPPPQPPVPTPAPAHTSVPVTVTAGKPPSFEKPDRFKGKSSEVETFVDAIQDAVELQGNSLTTERSKCIYMSTFLENSPKQWYRGIKKSHPLLLESFPLFIKAFIDHFGDSNLAYNATGKLEKLTQTGSAAAYAARFRELLVYVNWTEESKINQFYKNLKPATKDLIATKKRSKRPTDFNKYVEFVIEYDNCVHERETERKEEKHGSSNVKSSSLQNPIPITPTSQLLFP
ncbi:hypothetical protein D9757_010892 [Collybiopsis confluens]|uniref:Ty3 transposon capsid-like protein domain-containing protein n=1 Tax=Collybiopsis confluens TaxID=2823264 RepID=A0A8H5GIH1_9AGAR|nr:hypothetical protein D9757_010892 [Collybiopsis confluens]